MTQHIEIAKSFIKIVLFGLTIALIPITLNAQLFVENALYPGISSRIGKYYNGTGGKGYWTKEYMDSIGRVIKKESYHKKQLRLRQSIVYDYNNNILFDIQTNDYNNPSRVDTFRYEYKYSGNQIIYQFRKLSENDSSVIVLMQNHGDTVIKYQEKVFYYRQNSKKTDVYETIYTLKYKNGVLISEERFDKKENSRENVKYEYFDNGRLKWRSIERFPEPEIKGIYTGGPGSDDEYYKYKLDPYARLLKFYKIIGGKKYKIAIYKYQ